MEGGTLPLPLPSRSTGSRRFGRKFRKTGIIYEREVEGEERE